MKIELKKPALGIELGSTRIKAVLTGPKHKILSAGEHTWENRLENGFRTVSRAQGTLLRKR